MSEQPDLFDRVAAQAVANVGDVWETGPDKRYVGRPFGNVSPHNQWACEYWTKATTEPKP